METVVHPRYCFWQVIITGTVQPEGEDGGTTEVHHSARVYARAGPLERLNYRTIRAEKHVRALQLLRTVHS